MMNNGLAKRRNKGIQNTIVVGANNDEFSGIDTKFFRQSRAEAMVKETMTL